MKTRKFYHFLVAILALNISMVACSSDDGEIGSDGLKGEQGVVGPAGADGSIIYSGEGEPAASTGIKDDYYCNCATGILYGPKKENASWESSNSFSLKGQNGTNGTNGDDGHDGNNGTNGTNGTDGSKTLSGTGLPSNTIGNTGDYYLNKENYTLYGPKANLVPIGQTLWGAGLELKGADGNANVKSYLFSILESQWLLNESKNKLYAYDLYSLSAKITNEIIDNGVVLVYRIDSNDHAILLPNSSKTPTGNLLTETFTFGGQDVCYWSRDLFTYANAEEILLKATYNYRAVFITGQAAIELNANTNNQIEFERLVGELAK